MQQKKLEKEHELGGETGGLVVSPSLLLQGNTYNFELLHCLFTHVHPSGLLHLHQAQVLTDGDNKSLSTIPLYFNSVPK